MLRRPALPISDLTPACSHFEAVRRPVYDLGDYVEPAPRHDARRHRPAPVDHVRALATSTMTDRPSYLPPPEMTAEHAAAWLPFIRRCAGDDAGMFFEVDSRVLDAACAALGIEPLSLGLEPGARG